MKLRIRDNSIRVRLSKSEVDTLGKGAMVSNELEFPGGKSICFQLLGGNQFNAAFDEDTVRITAPEETLREWVASEELSLSQDLPVSSASSLWILIEKDLQCKTDRPREEDSEAIQNTVANNS